MDSRNWGDVRPSAVEGFLRVGFWNCGGFPRSNSNIKNSVIRHLLTSNSFDLFGFSECNIHWPALPISQRLHERTLGWFESVHITSSFLTPWHSSNSFQVGGVSLWSINSGSHRVITSGSDSSHLGRWTWTTFRGRNGLVLRSVVAYRCVLNKDGPLSAWSQQTTILNQIGLDVDPRKQFIDDLIPLIDSWLEAGELLIIGLDLNEDVVSSSFTSLLAQRGLVECITHRHGTSGPATYHRGSKPIDGIYVSSSLRDVPCGYLTFHGDHRVLWADIPHPLAFGSTLPTPPIRARRLKLQDPRIVHKYQTLLDSFYRSHSVYDDILLLDDSVESTLSLPQADTYERIDSLRVEGMRYAEKHCRRLCMGTVDFTPQFTTLAKQVLCWNLIVKFVSGKRIDSRYFRRTLKKQNLKLSDIRSLTEIQAQTRRNQVYSALRSLSKSSSVSRNTWLHDLSVARAEAGDLTAEQEYNSLLARERQRKNARLIKSVFRPWSSFGLSMLHSINPDGEFFNVTNQSDMEEMLFTELQQRFNQASNTPFATPPLASLVGHLGISPSANLILQGRFNPPDHTDYWATRLIPHLQSTPHANLVHQSFPLEFSLESHCRGWKKMKERTSPGFSQLSFAQFKAAALHPDLASIDCIMSAIPYRTGYSPLRWRKGIDVMLQKQQGNFLPSKLRAILLYEPDFNQNNKLLGRELMYWAEKTDSMALEQFGSRRSKSAIDQSLNKVLTFDLWRQFKCSGALCSNDAKSCYDRIVHSVASLSMQRIGLPSPPIVSMFSTIQSLEHHVRTLHGVSPQSFSGATWDPPIQGVGQGNGAGPQVWAAVSTPVLNMLRSDGLGSSFVSAISHDRLFFVGYAFVDDVDLVISDQASFDVDATARNIQSSLNAWEGGIRATGGAIVPDKSYWYLVHFIWKNGVAHYSSITDAPATLKVNDSFGVQQTLRRLEPWEADRTLGVRIAPDGNMQSQFQFMKDCSTNWSDRIRSGHLNPSLVYQAFNSTIMRTLQFPLPATTLSASQCKSIMAPLFKHVLPRMGCVRNFPTVLRHAPQQYLGLGLPNLYWLQGIDHVDRMVRYGVSNHLTGQLIRQSLEIMQLEVGCLQPVFSLSYSTFGPLVTKSWLSSTWEFLSSNTILLDSGKSGLTTNRIYDQALIPLFLSKGFKGKQLVILNRCRIYLQVTLLSDIVTGCGTKIIQSAWDGIPDSTRPSSLNWPFQAPLPPDHWRIWHQSLSSLCSAGLTLSSPLGPWTSTSTLHHFFSPSDQRIYESSPTGWLFCPRLPGRSSRNGGNRFGPSQSTAEVPDDILPATVVLSPSFLRLTGVGNLELDQSPIPQSLSEFILLKIPPTCHWAILPFSTTGVFTIPSFSPSDDPLSFHAVSDGSFKEQHGTASWIIWCDQFDCQWSGSLVTPGTRSIQSAYRSELAGLYAIVSMLYSIQQYYSLLNISATIGCDGLSALTAVNNSNDFISPNIDHFDIIFATRTISKKLKGSLQWKHIKGHQDDIADAPLDTWALRNIEMDTNAKEFWTLSSPISDSERVHHLWCEPWSVSTPTGKISSSFRDSLIDHLGRYDAIRHWENRYQISRPSLLNDWSHYTNALRSLPFARRMWVCKLVSGFLPTAVNMHRRNLRSDDICPQCSSAPENHIHIITCPFPTAVNLWSRKIEDLHQWLLTHDTFGDMAALICDRLRSWQSDSPPTFVPANQFGLLAAVEAQDSYGWDKFCLGFPCDEWYSVQSRYLSFINGHRSLKRWMAALVKKLWNISWDMWEHRNGYLHDLENGALSADVNTHIKHQFELGTTTLPLSSRRLLRRNIDSVLTLHLNERVAWINRVEAARSVFSISQEASDAAFRTERQVMFRWLHS